MAVNQPDFKRSAGILLNLVRGSLALGRMDEASERIRTTLVQAFEQGAESSRKAQRLVNS